MIFSATPILLIFFAATLCAAVILCGWFTYKVLHPKAISLSDCLQKELQKGWLDPTSFANLNREHFAIPSKYGYALHGEYIQTAKSTKTIILSHGISSNRYGMLRYIPLFQDLGFNIMSYDMRGHGESGGKNISYGYFEKQDLVSLVDWLIDKHSEKITIGTMGVSLGAAVSLQHAAIDPRLTFTIAEASFSDLSELLAYRLKAEYNLPPFPFIPVTAFLCRSISGMDLYQVSPERAGATIKTPVFIIHGEDDNYIPPHMSLNIFNSLATFQKRLYHATGAGHSSSLRADPEEYKQQVAMFLSSIGIKKEL